MNLVEIEDLHYSYLDGTPFATVALRGITMQVRDGEFLGILGPSQSGKSTLIQFFNGLLTSQRGRVSVLGSELGHSETSIMQLRRNVGLVFQYPEDQLFAESVYADVAFGPRNFEIPEDEIESRVDQALRQVGLDPGSYRDRMVTNLSGGEKRRVAIAGVLASSPRLLVFDEPTAGIDPRTREMLLSWMRSLHEEGVTVVVATTSAEEIAAIADRFVILKDGRVVKEGTPAKVLADENLTSDTGIGVPVTLRVVRRLRELGHDVSTDFVPTTSEVSDVIAQLLENGTMVDTH